MPRLTQHPQVAAGIVLENHTDVLLAFVVLFKALDSRDLAAQRKVKYVPTLMGIQTNAMACPYLSSSNYHMVDLLLIFEKAPLPLIHRTSSLSGVNPRNTP
ncbi:hypothetical protein [Tunturiibacter gelidoferens]|uniref:Uncharacterized protein n=1 Tax=Tunturiibacter lichenicola TaxID=2051959 RepID=A0A7Y9NQD8_9BACT|nr:hypothetical protein [Edaphobacter lichenicola]NYF53643.1 hypothetical protein [Edaphobacter lichenicola]